MKYEDALKAWGANKIALKYNFPQKDINPNTVKVNMEFDEGYNCCGGYDPDCFCSFAESPRAEVVITGVIHYDNDYREICASIPIEDFDFATILKELCDIGNGSITS